MVNVYLIGHITVKDVKKWQFYRNLVPASLEPWHGELVLRGKLSRILTGSHHHTDTVIIKFPNLQSLNGWYNSSRYQSLIPVREEAADMELLVFSDS